MLVLAATVVPMVAMGSVLGAQVVLVVPLLVQDVAVHVAAAAPAAAVAVAENVPAVEAAHRALVAVLVAEGAVHRTARDAAVLAAVRVSPPALGVLHRVNQIALRPAIVTARQPVMGPLNKRRSYEDDENQMP